MWSIKECIPYCYRLKGLDYEEDSHHARSRAMKAPSSTLCRQVEQLIQMKRVVKTLRVTESWNYYTALPRRSVARFL
jgi:hypothetical protein